MAAPSRQDFGRYWLDKDSFAWDYENVELFKALSQSNIFTFNDALRDDGNPYRRHRANLVNRKGVSPLNFVLNSCVVGYDYFVKRLIEKGADVNFVDSTGYSPLDTALRAKIPESSKMIGVETLLRNGAIPSPNSLFHALGKFDLTEILLRHRANPNIASASGDTPLHFAVLERKPEVVELLLSYGANPRVVNNIGDTPMSIAIRRNYDEIYQLLNEFVMPAFRRKRRKRRNLKSLKSLKSLNINVVDM